MNKNVTTAIWLQQPDRWERQSICFGVRKVGFNVWFVSEITRFLRSELEYNCY
jgi:hypothetical protein